MKSYAAAQRRLARAWDSYLFARRCMLEAWRDDGRTAVQMAGLLDVTPEQIESILSQFPAPELARAVQAEGARVAFEYSPAAAAYELRTFSEFDGESHDHVRLQRRQVITLVRLMLCAVLEEMA